MSFWRSELIDFALRQETEKHICEQMEWIARDPENATPYYNLAQLYRIEGRAEEALGLLLEAVRLDAEFAGAHVALAGMYAVKGDYPAAWKHARSAESCGNSAGIELLSRYGVATDR
ncbi:MAG TPA: tetratricopeptide repeat protein [Bryobacteraceae bacterium]|nr:tetratricopeptide repeat protein [Bryobacteraceae bacterium]